MQLTYRSQGRRKKFLKNRKKGRIASQRAAGLCPSRAAGCENARAGVRSGRMGLSSSWAVRTRLAASYAAAAAGPLTSELQYRVLDRYQVDIGRGRS